jgi:hypothetical protein
MAAGRAEHPVFHGGRETGSTITIWPIAQGTLLRRFSCAHGGIVRHAFVWYGKTSEKQVGVAGLHPSGDALPYVLGHLTWVPSETRSKLR